MTELTAKDHNLSVQSKIKKLLDEVEELKATIKPLDKHVNPPLHVLAAAQKKLSKASKPKPNAVKIKSPEVAKPKKADTKKKG